MQEIIAEDEDIIEVGDFVEEDSSTNIPSLIGELSRGFDPTFPSRYLKFYKKLSDNPLEAIKEVRDDPIKFIEYCCRTKSRDKQTGKITLLCFELYATQKVAVLEMIEYWKNGQSAAFLKSRQQGASWMAVCVAFYIAIFYREENILCTSKSDDDLHQMGNLKSFMEKFVFLYRNLHPYLRKQIIYKFEYKKYFFQINDSVIQGGLGPDPARGGSFTLSLNDEFAYNPKPGEVLASIEPCCNVNFFISTKRNRNDEYDRLLNSPEIKKIRLFWRDDPQIKDKEEYRRKTIAVIGLHRFNVEVDMLYSDADILKVFDNDMLDKVKLLKPRDAPSGDIIAGFDVAGLGADANVLVIRQGHSILRKEKWCKTYAHESVDKILKIYSETPFGILIFDEIGVGYSIASEFERRIDSIPFSVQGVSVNTEAAEKGVLDDLLGEEDRQVYFNLRSKLHWTLKKIIENTFADAPVAEQSELLYLQDEDIINDMYNIPLDEKAVKKIKVASKVDIRKTLGHSPNDLDALLFTYAADRYIAQAEIENYLYSRVY